MEEEILGTIAKVLGITTQAIKNFIEDARWATPVILLTRMKGMGSKQIITQTSILIVQIEP